MSNKNKLKIKGFTLIELLAIIVLLAIISLITVPIITGVIKKAKIETFKSKVKITGETVQEYLLQHKYVDFQQTGVTVTQLKSIEKNDFISGKYIDKNGVVEAWYVTDGKYCAKGPLKNLRVNEHCYKLDDTLAEYNESKIHITATTRAITVQMDAGFATDEESGIKEYRVSVVLIQERLHLMN